MKTNAKVKAKIKNRSLWESSGVMILSLFLVASGLFLVPSAWGGYPGTAGEHYIDCDGTASFNIGDKVINEGESFYLEVMRYGGHNIGERFGNNNDFYIDTFKAMISTEDGTADHRDYQHLSRKEPDDHSHSKRRLKFLITTKEDDVIEEDETFTIRTVYAGVRHKQRGEGNSNHWHDVPVFGEHNECTVTIRDNDVGIIGMQMASTPQNGDTYRLNEVIKINVTFNRTVEVSGPIFLHLFMAGGNGWRGASYKSGSGTETLHFSYTVKSGDRDDNGISIGGTGKEVVGLANSGASVKSKFRHLDTKVDAKRTFNGSTIRRNLSDHKVNGKLSCGDHECDVQDCFDDWMDRWASDVPGCDTPEFSINGTSCKVHDFSCDDGRTIEGFTFTPAQAQ